MWTESVPGRGKIELRHAPVELAEIVSKGVEMASPLIDQRHQQLSVEVPPAGLLVSGDSVRLAQVVGNLLNNAAKYAHVGRQIGVTACRDKGELTLTVVDDGPGIQPELLPKSSSKGSCRSTAPMAAWAWGSPW